MRQFANYLASLLTALKTVAPLVSNIPARAKPHQPSLRSLLHLSIVSDLT